MILKGALGSTVTIFQLEFRYASYIPSLSFLGQTEAEIKNYPPLGRGGGSDPPRGGRGSTVTIFQLEFRYGSYIPSLSFLGQTEAEIKNCPPPA